MWNIFEQPWTGLVIAVISLNVIAVVRWFVPLERKWLFIPTVAIASLALALCYLVETDKEKVQNIITQGIKAVRSQKADDLEKLIASQYSDSAHATKKEFVRSWRMWLGEVKLENVGVSNAVYEMGDAKATVTFNWSIRFGKQTGTFDYMSGVILYGQARVILAETTGRKWQIRSAELLEIMNQSTSWQKVNF